MRKVIAARPTAPAPVANSIQRDTRTGIPVAPIINLGDMPNLRADAAGHATLTYTIRGGASGKGSANLINQAVIVHGGANDYTSQPAGDAGPRIACGVIRVGS